MKFVHVSSLDGLTQSWLLWLYMLMTSTSLVQLMPSPRLFHNSKVNLRSKILAKPFFVLACRLNMLQEVFSTSEFVHSEAIQALLNGCGSPTEFPDGGMIIRSK